MNPNIPKTGTRAPNFRSLTSGRDGFELYEALKTDNNIMLVFYRGHWCLYCATQLEQIKLQYQNFRSLNTEVYAISVDTVEQSELVKKSSKLPYELLCDPDKEAVLAYDLLNRSERSGIAFPAIFIISPNSEIVYRSLDKTSARVDFTEIISFLKKLRLDPNYKSESVLESSNKQNLIPPASQWSRVFYTMIRKGSLEDWRHFLYIPYFYAKKWVKNVFGYRKKKEL